MKFNKTIISIFFIALLSACSSDEVKDSFLDDDAASVVDGGSDIDSESYNVNGAKVAELDLDNNRHISALEALMQSPEFSDPNSPLSKRTIYFEYDSSLVSPEFIPVLEAHANYLMSNPTQRITLEGHSDERGTREYNVSLGEQRAKSVFKMLQLIGVMSNQIDIVSYGEEKPAELGHNTEALRLNRRVEVVYK